MLNRGGTLCLYWEGFTVYFLDNSSAVLGGLRGGLISLYVRTIGRKPITLFGDIKDDPETDIGDLQSVQCSQCYVSAKCHDPKC